jgi:hypothetical protein
LLFILWYLEERIWFWLTSSYAFLRISHNQTSLDPSFTHQDFVLYNFSILFFLW